MQQVICNYRNNGLICDFETLWSEWGFPVILLVVQSYWTTRPSLSNFFFLVDILYLIHLLLKRNFLPTLFQF